MNRSSDGFNFGNNPTQFNPQFNVSNNHPLIKNSQEYLYYKKYVSIHSEDRDMIKYPESSVFEIEMPEDITNVYSLRLVDWAFPANYNTFSTLNTNVTMTFKINSPYNPNENLVSNNLLSSIFEALYLYNDNYLITIEDGFYNPNQMSIELTNKFNETVSQQILTYFNIQINNPPPTQTLPPSFWETMVTQFIAEGQYNRFIIVYNEVGQKFWFGNTCDSFILTNESTILYNASIPNISCGIRANQKEFSSWGLPCNLGLERNDITSKKGSQIINGSEIKYTPRFYYGDVNPGDNGFWLLPNTDLSGSFVYYIEANYKINLMGPSHFYIELEGQNCIDETSPYVSNEFSFKNPNTTNGIVNSSFAKIPLSSTPVTQCYGDNNMPYKFYDPPADRIRRLYVKIRYHNGQLVNFGVFNYTFTLEFTTLLPQINRKIHHSHIPPFIQS